MKLVRYKITGLHFYVLGNQSLCNSYLINLPIPFIPLALESFPHLFEKEKERKKEKERQKERQKERKTERKKERKFNFILPVQRIIVSKDSVARKRAFTKRFFGV